MVTGKSNPMVFLFLSHHDTNLLLLLGLQIIDAIYILDGVYLPMVTCETRTLTILLLIKCTANMTLILGL